MNLKHLKHSHQARTMMLLLLFTLQKTYANTDYTEYAMEQSLLTASADFHAYEDAWSVTFTNIKDVNFNVIFFEICSDHNKCDADNSDAAASTLRTCDELTHMLNATHWYNQYLHNTFHNGNAFDSLEFCKTIYESPDSIQTLADDVISDNASPSAPFVRVRQPLSLVVFNKESLLQQWTTSSDQNTYVLGIRITRVLVLTHKFATYNSVLFVGMNKPKQSFFSFSVQNPCTAVGYAAPEFGGVQLKTHNGIQRCVMTCRIDTLRVPYSAVPPTNDQLNQSHTAYLSLKQKYACKRFPGSWAAIFFSFSLESNMIVGQGYSQIFFDAIDALAFKLEQIMSANIPNTIALGVPNTIYHEQSFQQSMRHMADVTCALEQCTNQFYPNEEGWVNNAFSFDRRRARHLLHTMQVHSVRVDGVLITEHMPLLTNSSYRVRIVHELQEAIEQHASTLQIDDENMQIVNVEQVDVERVLGFATAEALHVAPVTPQPGGPGMVWSLVDDVRSEYDNDPTAYILLAVLGTIVLAAVVLCCMWAKQRKKVKTYGGRDYRAAAVSI